MSQRYFTDEEILREVAVLVPISGWPLRDSVLARLAEARHPNGFTTWVAMWPEGVACTLIVGANEERPPRSQIARAYRQYHDLRQEQGTFSTRNDPRVRLRRVAE